MPSSDPHLLKLGDINCEGEGEDLDPGSKSRNPLRSSGATIEEHKIAYELEAGHSGNRDKSITIDSTLDL